MSKLDNPADPDVQKAQRESGNEIPARALHTDPNYKARDAGIYDPGMRRDGMFDTRDEAPGSRDQQLPKDDNKDEEDKSMWEKFKEGAVEFENRVAAALQPLEERVNNATTDANNSIRETGDDMNKNYREHEAKEEAKKQEEEALKRAAAETTTF